MIDITESISRRPFGVTPDGLNVTLFTLANRQGMSAQIINYGGIITSLHVPDRSGNPTDIVLGHDNLERYFDKSRYFGALVGRYGHRIADGRFSLDGKTYELGRNNGPNHLHGGTKGFDKVVWGAKEIYEEAPGVELSYLSVDGEEGYPGNLNVRVKYLLTENNELRLEYFA